MHFNIPLDEVELVSIKDYRLMRFTIFNNAVLTNGLGEFRYKTDEEEEDELESQIAYYKSKGFFKDG